MEVVEGVEGLRCVKEGVKGRGKKDERYAQLGLDSKRNRALAVLRDHGKVAFPPHAHDGKRWHGPRDRLLPDIPASPAVGICR